MRAKRAGSPRSAGETEKAVAISRTGVTSGRSARGRTGSCDTSGAGLQQSSLTEAEGPLFAGCEAGQQLFRAHGGAGVQLARAKSAKPAQEMSCAKILRPLIGTHLNPKRCGRWLPAWAGGS